MTYSLQELDALCAAATPGPWTTELSGSGEETRVLGIEAPAPPVDFPEDAAEYDDNDRATRVTIVETDSGCYPPRRRDADFIVAARTAIPELIAEIRRLDPGYHAAPPSESVARATELMREAAEKRARLEKALADAKLGDLRELSGIGLEAYFDDDGNVRIKQKARAQGAP